MIFDLKNLIVVESMCLLRTPMSLASLFMGMTTCEVCGRFYIPIILKTMPEYSKSSHKIAIFYDL